MIFGFFLRVPGVKNLGQGLGAGLSLHYRAAGGLDSGPRMRADEPELGAGLELEQDGACFGGVKAWRVDWENAAMLCGVSVV